MSKLRWVYKIIRTILFTAVILIGGLFVSIYLILSIPPVQNYIRERAQKELSEFLGGELSIGSLNISPFNEILCKDVGLKDPDGEECLKVGELGAGINFWRLILDGKIEITYVDLLDFDINIYQRQKDSPLNIDFLIQAFSPKDKTKPPTIFDLKIHNIVLRNGQVQFSKLWQPREADSDHIDYNYLSFNEINADITLPRIANDHFEIDLRRIALKEKSGLEIKDLTGFFKILPNEIMVSKFSLSFPSTTIDLPDFTLKFNDFKDIVGDLMKRDYEISFKDLKIIPSDFSPFYPELSRYNNPVILTIAATGNVDDFNIHNLKLKAPQIGIDLDMSAQVKNALKKENLELYVDDFSINLQHEFWDILLSYLSLNENVKKMIHGIGELKGDFSGVYLAREKKGAANVELVSDYGQIKFAANGSMEGKMAVADGSVQIPSFNIGELLSRSEIGKVENAVIIFDLRNLGGDPKDISGMLDANVGKIGVMSREFENIDLHVNREASHIDFELDIADNDLLANLRGETEMKELDFHLVLNGEIGRFDTYTTFLTPQENKYEFKGNISADLTGNNIENLHGYVSLRDLTFFKNGSKPLQLDHLELSSVFMEDGQRRIMLDSDVVDVNVEGNFNPALLPKFTKTMLSYAMPSLISGYEEDIDCGSGNFSIDFENAETIIDFFQLPIDPLTRVMMDGAFNSDEKTLDFSTDIPYIVQNGNKLIRDSYLAINIDGKIGKAGLNAGTVYPTKKGDLKMDVILSAVRDHYDLFVGFNEGLDKSFHGSLSFEGNIEKDPLLGVYDVDFNVNPTSLFLNGAEWKVGASNLSFRDNTISVKDFSVRHDDQFVLIDGVSDRNVDQFVEVKLSGIDLSYIFDTLNINYVTFGGLATGEVFATELFSANPQIKTRYLDVKNLSYNGAVLGDGKLSSSFDLPEKKVNIHADITKDDRNVATVDGGVWIGKDSLAFDFNTDKVDIRFLKPFMKAFTSDVKGHATGDLTLYGTFRDIDMKGKVFADDISLLVDYTNVWYSGSDSVFIEPGEIRIPDFKLYDKYGNGAVLNGMVRHSYFHLPEFDFDVTNIRNLLVYDTNPKMNPIWYGTIFGSGTAKIEGKPGYVNILADMTTDDKTVFTFVLSDEQQATKSNFLTFSDRKKESLLAALEQQQDSIPDFLKRFQKQQQEEEEGEPDIFSLDLRASVTPEAELILIMDPAAGDKITAYGGGAMNITYDSKSDEMGMFGKYILDHGTYNFSLQDIILKDFVIKPGSTISFTGSPYSGILDITAAYKVNTSLTELDNSFASDRELNRTNVPVEALLKVTGPMMDPDIAFDIDLPTVTEETARKVKSIISTEDMMNRQVIYLVALNKFYSPEYMGMSSTGGEWASVASSTLSSQIQNMIGQLTDKFTLSPSLRSDKGDFSDLEFDVALSSSLFNNRLLINGNLGYRDPSTSNTTFVGDFDIEYLLNRRGNLRLKAYNHFNDQNYYLKSALTTQGIGVVWTTDFDNLNMLFNRRRKEKTEKEPTDSVSGNNAHKQ